MLAEPSPGRHVRPCLQKGWSHHGAGGGEDVQARGSLLPPLPHSGSLGSLVEPKGVLSPPALMPHPICPLVHPLKQSRPLHTSRDGALISSQDPSLFGVRDHVPQLVLPLPRGPPALYRLFLLPGLA